MFEHQGREVKRVGIKGLSKDGAIPFEQFVKMMSTEAMAGLRQQQRREYQHVRFAPNPQWPIRMAQALQQTLAQVAHKTTGT